MRIKYEVITEKCPHCGHILKVKNTLWQSVLGILFFPFIIIFWLPYDISYILLEKIFDVDFPPKKKFCPLCGGEIIMMEDIGQIFSGATGYGNSSLPKEWIEYQNLCYRHRWLFRFAYFLGGTMILSIFFGFFLLSPHPTDKIIGTVFLSMVPVFFVTIVGIVLFWKNKEKRYMNKHYK